MYTPTWGQYEEDMKTKTGEEALKAGEAFIEERKKETAKSTQARQWEEDRKKEIFKNKGEWTKKRLEEEHNNDPKTQLLKELKDGGSFKSNIKPTGGYILIEIVRETQTASGLYLANTEVEPNTAIVLEVGEPLMKVNVYNKLDKIPSPAEVGQKILFKKFAGLNVNIQNKECRLIQFTDVLAIIE